LLAAPVSAIGSEHFAAKRLAESKTSARLIARVRQSI
jgi:hypothetical protein